MAVDTDIFPLFLDADAVAVTADDATFEVTSSRVTLNGTASCDLTTGFSETITFNGVRDTATCMYFDGGWRVIANDGCAIA